MASKLEYLQRYMDKGSETTEKKLKKKRKKEKPSTSSSLRIVDGDHDWAQEIPQRARAGAGQEEDAMAHDDVMANGAIDPEDMPTIANADQYHEELQRERESALKKNTDEGIMEANRNVDLSPPRRRRGDRGCDDASPPRRGRMDEGAKQGNTDGDDDGDASPPRRRQRNKSDDGSSLRRVSAHDGSDGDVSPQRRPSRREEGAKDDDSSPPRRRPETKSRDRSSQRPSSPRHGTERSDRSGHGRRATSSPPRRGSDRRSRSRSRARSSRPERRRSPSRSMDRSRHRSRRSLSPRDDHHSRGRSFSPDDRKRGKNDERRSRSSRHHSSSRSRSKSASPPRRPSVRLSSSKRKEIHDGDDASPPRKSQRKSSDDLPLTAVQVTTQPSVPASAVDEYKPRAGLFTATEFAEDLKKKVAHNDILRGATAEDMGHNAETVYRDKKGRKLDMLSEMVKQQEIMDGKLKREAQDQYEWGTGRVQKEEKLSQKELLDKMKSKPFARRDDDEELEKMRRERVRAFDPMDSKVFQDDSLFHDGTSSTKKTKKKSKKNKSSKKAPGRGGDKPKYAGPPAPPNRFGVQPGYRWDGVVRGTAWEEKLMLRDNALNANSDEAYRYAVADM